MGGVKDGNWEARRGYYNNPYGDDGSLYQGVCSRDGRKGLGFF